MSSLHSTVVAPPKEVFYPLEHRVCVLFIQLTKCRSGGHRLSRASTDMICTRRTQLGPLMGIAPLSSWLFFSWSCPLMTYFLLFPMTRESLCPAQVLEPKGSLGHSPPYVVRTHHPQVTLLFLILIVPFFWGLSAHK